MPAVRKLVNISDLVDELGKIKADIADLEIKEKKSVATLKDRGAGEYAGKLFQANISTQVRNKVVDYEGLAKAARIPAQLIRKHTTTVTPKPYDEIDWPEILKEAEVAAELVEKHTTGDEILVCKVTARK